MGDDRALSEGDRACQLLGDNDAETEKIKDEVIA
jgi:hypothetical protein